ncbi:unnamed protein product [Miscanthus lutarioriparius]|uniref:Uncharacterized protein n=1 Tax=Miscanthus lutarioriparius TaxID=422564 RepID=A0A811NJQ6_9POAL|nr:unnamed protein product [Miscanthus lutarioriparius]
MPKIKTSRVKYPEGWELIEPTIRELDAKMREAENDPHDGKRKCEALWPIFRISHQRSRYIYDLYYRRKEISKELYEFCLDQGYADRNLIAKWKKPGYERLCCLRCIQTRDHNFATTCVCRVPKHLREEQVGGDERSSGAGGGGVQYVIRYEEDGEMERVLERQAELIGQYEEEEKAQREWEKQYSRNANKGDMELKNKAYQTDAGAKSNVKNLANTNNPTAERLQKGSLSESPQNGARRREGEANEEPDHGCAQTSSISAPESSNDSTVTRQDQDRGNQISDGDSGYSTNARSPKHDAVIRAPSDGSPSSDTLNSKVTDWSSSQFHDCTDSQLDTQSSYPPPSCSIAHVESVLQALQRARISLSARLSKPVPPSQVTLALPAPGDEHREYDDLPANDDDEDSYGEKLSCSSPALQEMLVLPAPEDYHERDREDSTLDDAATSHVEKSSSSSPPREEMLALPAPGHDYRKEIEDYMKIPVGTPGLFRLPIDSFPVDEKMFSGTACGSGFSLGAGARHATSILSNTAASCGATTSVPSISGDGSGFPSRH